MSYASKYTCYSEKQAFQIALRLQSKCSQIFRTAQIIALPVKFLNELI